MNTPTLIPDFVNRKSFIELDARARAQSLFDEGTSKELVGPFDRIESPWLAKQGIAPQSDDGCIVIKGRIGGSPAVAIAFEGAFQGGSVGEVSGAKMTAALDPPRRIPRRENRQLQFFCSKQAACAFRKPTLVWQLLPRLPLQLSPFVSMPR
jgi:hypothetical protein